MLQPEYGLLGGALDGIFHPQPSGQSAVGAHQHHGLARLPHAVPPVMGRPRFDPQFLQHPGVAHYQGLSADPSPNPSPGNGLEFLDGVQIEAAALGRFQDGPCQGVLAGLLQAGHRRQQLLFAPARQGRQGPQPGLAFCESARLVQNQGVHAVQGFQGRGILDQHAGAGSPSGRHHDGHGGGQAESAGAGDYQHGHGIDQAVSHRGLRPQQAPDHKGQKRDQEDRGDEAGRHRVGEALDGRACPLGFRHHPDDPGQQGVLSDPGGAHDETAGLIHGAAGHPVSGKFLDRKGLAGQHGFIHRTGALEDLSISRDALPGSNPQACIDGDSVQRDFLLRSVLAQSVCGFGGQTQERADGAAGPLPGPKLQHLSQQHQCGDDGCRFEINGNGSVRTSKGIREQGGGQRGCQAVEEAGGCAHSDQGEHVEAAVGQGSPPALQQRPSPPEDHGGGQQALNPGRDPGQPVGPRDAAPDHLPHGQQEDGKRQNQADLETAPHGRQLRIVGLLQGNRFGFQGHAAQGTGSGSIGQDLGVHGAGVARRWAVVFQVRCFGGGGWARGGLPAAQIAIGVGLECGAAMRAAEVIGLSAKGVRIGRGLGVDPHAAHWVPHGVRLGT